MVDRSQDESFKYLDLGSKFIETGGDWRSDKPKLHVADSRMHDFILDFSSKKVDVVCSEVRLEDILLPEGEESPEGIGLEDGLIRYVDVKKRDNVLVSRIKHEINREPGEQKGRELWLVVFTEPKSLRLGDYMRGRLLQSSPAIINARDFVRTYGAGPFDRIYYFSLSRTADYIGPLAAANSDNTSQWRVLEYKELGFRIELPGPPVQQEEVELSGKKEVKSVTLELWIEGLIIRVAHTKVTQRLTVNSAVALLHNAIAETYRLPMLERRSFLWNSYPAADLLIGAPGQYVSVRSIAAPKFDLVILADSQLPTTKSPIIARILDSLAFV